MKQRLASTIVTCTLLGACAPRGSVPAIAPRVFVAEGVPPSLAAPPARVETLQAQDARDVARVGGLFAIATGVSAGFVAAVTSVIMLHDKSVRDANCDASKACSPDGLNANAGIAKASGWNVGTWALAAVGLGLGAFLVLSNQSDRQPETQIGVAPIGSGGGLSLRSGF
ncbi:MAG: hypothetical protein ABSF69_13395 [Polyangiaceae bacterium]|jgi:hypothetical protein